MKPIDALLIGHESLLVQCGKLLVERGHKVVAVVSDDPEVTAWAESAVMPVLAPGPGLELRLAEAVPEGFDWLFSIGNTRLISQSVLELARAGAINFHDGPLPLHAGLNAPVWGLLEGDTRWGVSWHMITGGVDMGDIVEQVMFDIEPGETALSLNARCFARGLDSFPAVVAAIEADDLRLRLQDMTQRSLHRRDDRPAGAGRLDFSRPAPALAAFVRALDHGNYRNPLTLPKLQCVSGVYAVGRAELPTLQADGAAPGTVLEVDETGLSVACGEGVVRLEALSCLQGLPVSPPQIASKGAQLPIAQMEGPQQALARIAAGEAYWRNVLAVFMPARPLGLRESGALAGDNTGGDRISRDLPDGVSARRAAAVLAAHTGLDGGASGMAYANDALAATIALAPDDIAPFVPLQPVGTCLADFESAIDACAEMTDRHPGFALDLVAREPGLSPMAVPALGLSENGESIPGCALCVVGKEQGATRLVADSARVDASALDIWLARIAHLASADCEAPLDGMELLSPPEEALLAAVNDTAQPYDGNATLSRLFEAQVARSPDATALVFEDRELSYRELDARANRLAHVLQNMGVGPDVPVALCTRRSPEMMIAALGILKAGGAYVPLDPSYPSARLDHYLRDSGAPVIVTQAALVDSLPAHAAELLVIDTDTRLDSAPESAPKNGAGPESLAYLIYTSGSTGQPKGVMVEHRNVVNFFIGMDARIAHEGGGVWLALTSLNFDISVLELFWTLTRGFKLVLTSDEDRLTLSAPGVSVSEKPMDFSLFYWGNDDGPGPQKYQLLLDGARFADNHGFSAVWVPERHFHAFGGPYPSPSVAGAAVAAVTRNIGVRSGSVVAPLHHPVRIAEEWAMIDNLTGGRVGLGIASGWHPVDFVLRPENRQPNNKAAMFDTINKVRRLWRGEAVDFDRGGGQMEPITTLPRPVSKELELWLTIAGNPDTWREAGEIGAHVLTHLLGQSIDEVAEKIGIYHQALRKGGRDPADFKVTLMLHTFVARSREAARETARGPMKSYLSSAAGLVKQYAWSFPAFKRPQGATSPMDLDLSSLSTDEVEGVLDYAFNRYFNDSGLFGSVDDCLARVEELKRIGVSEIACLIDYGIPTEQVLEGLYPLAEVLARSNRPSPLGEDDYSLAAQIRRHGVTHLQCTPSFARLLLADEGARAALGGLRQMLIGGEALPATLASELSEACGGEVLNMYGPTETTIWSTSGPAGDGEPVALLGSPIANTTLHVLDERMRPVPLGVPAELWIGGAGVARGYWRQEALSAERFRPAPEHLGGAGRLYRTGDRVRLDSAGRLAFLGRADGQIKIRGHRAEAGEIEQVLEAAEGIEQAVVILRGADNGASGEGQLVAYVSGPRARDEAFLRAQAAASLPTALCPSVFVAMESFPLTPNKKIDRNALPLPHEGTRPPATAAEPSDDIAAGSDTMAQVAEIWQAVLGVERVGAQDSFFALGGHSLLAVHAHRQMREKLALPGLSITDIFRFPVLSDFSAHVDGKLRPLPGKEADVSGPESPRGGAEASAGAGQARREAMARRRAMRAGRMNQAG